MKRTDGNADKGESGGRGSAFFKKNKKRKLLGGGGGGLSLEALAFGKNKPFATASQIRKQRELYQNAKKVQKYRKTVKHLAEEGHKFEPCIALTTSDAEVGGLNLLSFTHPCQSMVHLQRTHDHFIPLFLDWPDYCTLIYSHYSDMLKSVGRHGS
jgi:hypothetical protein